METTYTITLKDLVPNRAEIKKMIVNKMNPSAALLRMVNGNEATVYNGSNCNGTHKTSERDRLDTAIRLAVLRLVPHCTKSSADKKALTPTELAERIDLGNRQPKGWDSLTHREKYRYTKNACRRLVRNGSLEVVIGGVVNRNGKPCDGYYLEN